jgi:2-polyprenyl-6-methoxyphenol hydroxylase-like FAD-dependent oxidoreductase
MNAPNSSQFKIAVVGGGIGGLTLASVLQRAYKIKCTVFELDDTVDSRNQGGSLDLHVESGQLALEKADLTDQFRQHARYQGQDIVLSDMTGKILFRYVGSEGPTGGELDRPEIDRTVLRQMLIESLDEDVIQWGRKVVKVEEESKDKVNHRHTLTFQDGQTGTFDLVVGADGAWSKIRKIVSEETPTYTGVSFIECRLSNVDIDHPSISNLVGDGTFWGLQNNKGLLCQRNGDGSIRVYVALRIAENGLSHLDFSNPEIPRKYLMEQFSDWDDSLKSLIEESSTFIQRGCYMLPTDYTWKSYPGITLIGDAAHLMTPFAGEGANMAMLDGAKLAAAISQIVHDGKDLATTIENFERDMHNIVTGMAIESAENMNVLISEDGPQAVLKMFANFIEVGGLPTANVTFYDLKNDTS